MEPTVLGKMLRYHWVWLVVFALVGLAAGAVVGQQIEPEYAAKSSVVATVDVTGGIRPNELAQANNVAIARAQTYAELADSDTVLTPVISQLGSSDSVSTLASQVSAATVVTSPVITITATAGTALGASDLANAVAVSLIDTVNADAQAPASATVTVIRLAPLATANAPLTASTPAAFQFTALGLLVGILIGVSVAFGIAQADRRLRTRASVEEAIGRPVLGPLDRAARWPFPMSAKSLATIEVTESHRSVGSILGYMAREAGRRTWVTAGMTERDGAIPAILGIAKALAENGSRVLLIDIDFPRSPLAGRVHAVGAPGLAEVLTGTSDASVIQPTAVTGIDALPAGRTTQQTAGLIARAEFGALVQVLTDSYDFIFVMAPAVSGSALAGSASQSADAVLLVTRLGGTVLEDASQSTRTLESVGAAVVVIVSR